MITCLTIELVSGEATSYGAQTYESLPRIGEYVALDENEVGSLFEVVAVVHSTGYKLGLETNGADLYVKRLGLTNDVMSRMIQRYE